MMEKNFHAEVLLLLHEKSLWNNFQIHIKKGKKKKCTKQQKNYVQSNLI